MNDPPTLTPEAVAAYLQGHGLRCPFCGDDTLDDGPIEHEDDPSAEISCTACGRRWRDVYTLFAVDVLDDDGQFLATVTPPDSGLTLDPADTGMPRTYKILFEDDGSDAVIPVTVHRARDAISIEVRAADRTLLVDVYCELHGGAVKVHIYDETDGPNEDDVTQSITLIKDVTKYTWGPTDGSL